MKLHCLLPTLLLVGCVSPDPTTLNVAGGPLPQKPDAPCPASVRTPEELKAYPVGRYQDPNDPDLLHEGHTVYRAETSPEWDTSPNAPTSLPLGPGEMATADPTTQHVALTAELEQRLKQEDQLLHTTYEQNERLAQEIQALQADREHVLLPVPPAGTPVAPPQPKPPTNPPPRKPPVTAMPDQPTSWLSWLWPNPTTQTNPKK